MRVNLIKGPKHELAKGSMIQIGSFLLIVFIELLVKLMAMIFS